MANFKKDTSQDAQLLRSFRELPCMACGKFPPNEAHHIKTRGSGGGDDYWNILPLCTSCHTGSKNSWHQSGAVSFLLKHNHILVYLQKLGWELIDGKLRFKQTEEG